MMIPDPAVARWANLDGSLVRCERWTIVGKPDEEDGAEGGVAGVVAVSRSTISLSMTVVLSVNG